jgi:hypothetical protein
LMLTVLGGLAEFERGVDQGQDRRRQAKGQGQGRQVWPQAQTHPPPNPRSTCEKGSRGSLGRHRTQL